ncbi:hypothetical protein qu_953 [Acanthamoeba polyphaga mimivirus]|nr:hypothetical protein c7_R1141 [Mimivirus reunion]WMV62287.1 hypothetical protein qu_953 [Mimivirus sp.]WMV63264.1 hypothetical protein qu_953 [Acanthamoeba polyphaga mimivirus]WMV64241.1 hypothetical protein qu_953 [Mimivirus sp.]
MGEMNANIIAKPTRNNMDKSTIFFQKDRYLYNFIDPITKNITNNIANNIVKDVIVNIKNSINCQLTEYLISTILNSNF